MNEDMTPFFSGTRLYGDDFTGASLAAWFESEREGYADLADPSVSRPSYPYHALNCFHGWRHVKGRQFSEVLGLGSAGGEELEPLHGRVSRISIVEPSRRLRAGIVAGVEPTHVDPMPSGVLPFGDGTFDLVVCLGVLHHIANVSTVMREMGRVCAPGATVLLREPIVSQGDWRRPRGRLTANERGIPLPLFRRFVEHAGFLIEREAVCMFPPSRLLRKVFGSTWNSRTVVLLDALASRLTVSRYRYHPTSRWHLLQPVSVFFVLRKPHRHETAAEHGSSSSDR